MGKVSRPRVVTKEALNTTGLPGHVQVALAEIVGATRLGRMLAGLSTRRYRAGGEPVGDVDLKGTSRSAVSRRFVRGTQARVNIKLTQVRASA